MLKFLKITTQLICLPQTTTFEQSKHLNVKWHFFWEYVDDGHVKISKCSTDEQRADYFTRGLVFEKFDRNRKSNQGW